MLYNETIRKILEVKSYETLMSLLKVFSYVCIFFAIYLVGLNSRQYNGSYKEKENLVEMVSIIVLESFIGIASSIFLTSSVYGIN